MQSVPDTVRTVAAVVGGDGRRRYSRSAAVAAVYYSSPVWQVVDKSTGQPRCTVSVVRCWPVVRHCAVCWPSTVMCRRHTTTRYRRLWGCRSAAGCSCTLNEAFLSWWAWPSPLYHRRWRHRMTSMNWRLVEHVGVCLGPSSRRACDSARGRSPWDVAPVVAYAASPASWQPYHVTSDSEASRHGWRRRRRPCILSTQFTIKHISVEMQVSIV